MRVSDHSRILESTWLRIDNKYSLWHIHIHSLCHFYFIISGAPFSSPWLTHFWRIIKTVNIIHGCRTSLLILFEIFFDECWRLIFYDHRLSILQRLTKSVIIVKGIIMTEGAIVRLIILHHRIEVVPSMECPLLRNYFFLDIR